MATNRVHGGQRIKVTASANHTAGDLVYEGGFYGIAQDNVLSGAEMTLILDGVWNLKRAPATTAQGKILAAEATVSATSLVLLPYTSHPSLNSAATAGWRPIGRTIATGTATTAKVRLYGDTESF